MPSWVLWEVLENYPLCGEGHGNTTQQWYIKKKETEWATYK